MDFPGGSDGKASVYNAGDPGSSPGLGRSPGGGNGNPLQYYCLENPMDRGAWQATGQGVAKSRTRLSDFTHFTIDSLGLLSGSMVKNSPAQVEDAGDRFYPWVRKIPWRRRWQPTPVFLPIKSHGQRSLEGYSWAIVHGIAKSQTLLSN